MLLGAVGAVEEVAVAGIVEGRNWLEMSDCFALKYDVCLCVFGSI